MKRKTIHIGCSSYNTADWKGIFYPEDLPKNRWFEFYCRHFSTYELNATFYRFPTLQSLQSWYDKAPEIFVFSVKAPKQITHLNRFADCTQLIEDFYSTCKEGLQDKLGCILFQLPPSFNYTPERLELIFSYLRPEFKNVMEFRNESWWNTEVWDAFSKSPAIFCSVDYPKLPSEIQVTAPTAYMRFHGNPKLFYSEYGHEKFQNTVDVILKADDLEEIFIYFNNTASTAGILNALEMKSLLGEN